MGKIMFKNGIKLLNFNLNNKTTIDSPLTDDDVKDSIKSTLLSEKQEEVYNSTLEEWKKDLNVKLYEDRL